MSTKAKATGFGKLCCPECGDQNADVSLHLGDMDHFHCHECGEDFTRQQVEAIIARWEKVFAWLDAAPGRAD